jgi:hypothetical protein
LNLRGASSFESRTNVFLSGKAESAVQTRHDFSIARCEDADNSDS